MKPPVGVWPMTICAASWLLRIRSTVPQRSVLIGQDAVITRVAPLKIGLCAFGHRGQRVLTVVGADTAMDDNSVVDLDGDARIGNPLKHFAVGIPLGVPCLAVFYPAGRPTRIPLLTEVVGQPGERCRVA